MSDEVIYVEIESMIDSKATVSFEIVSEDWKLSDPDTELVDTEVQ